jgi:hypothetical protein
VRAIILILLAVFSTACPSPRPDPLPGPSASPRPALQPIQGMRFGLTLESVDNLQATLESLRAMPFRPMVRIVFQCDSDAQPYMAAVPEIARVADVVGQFSDSTCTGTLSLDKYVTRLMKFMAVFPGVNIWETCNECNGTGPGWNVPNGEVFAEAATRAVRGLGKQALFTPYWNRPVCQDDNGNYLAWVHDKLSPYVKQNTDYVTTSVYGHDCKGNPSEPGYAELDKMVATLSAEFPNALVGVGEYGTPKASDKAAIMRHYLEYRNANPRYFFFGGYWYGSDDLVPKTNPLWSVFISQAIL